MSSSSRWPLQGQSAFGGIGDTGAFGCVRSDGTTIVNLVDPPSQPWMTAVGGTSFENYNPKQNATPLYPAGGEAVWNVDNLCNDSADEGGEPPRLLLVRCDRARRRRLRASTGACRTTRRGPGVISPDTTYGNGSTQCQLAEVGTACRETPDISADADEYTPYAEYCTGDATTAQRCAPPSAVGRRRLGGSASAAPACRRRCGQQSPLIASASFKPPGRKRQPERCTSPLPAMRRVSSSTMSSAPATSRRTTGCMPRSPATTWQRASARSR